MDADIRKIVAPVDFSETSERAATYAWSLARRMGATLHLIHVLEVPGLTQGPFEFYVPETPALRERLYQDARSRLGAIVEELGGGSHHITTEVRDGETAPSIVSAAVDYGADLVVMATHGRTGLSHLLMGSVAERVIRSAPCPVLVIRALGQVPVRWGGARESIAVSAGNRG